MFHRRNKLPPPFPPEERHSDELETVDRKTRTLPVAAPIGAADSDLKLAAVAVAGSHPNFPRWLGLATPPFGGLFSRRHGTPAATAR